MGRHLIFLILLLSVLIQPLAMAKVNSTNSLEYNKVDCETNHEASDLIDEYVRLWGTSYTDVPAAPEQEQERDRAVISFVNTKNCILEHSFYKKHQYLETLDILKDKIRSTNEDTQSFRALMSLLFDLNERWAADTKLNRLFRDEKDATNFVTNSIGVSLLVAASHVLTRSFSWKDLLKFGRFVKHILHRPSAARMAQAFVGISSRQGAIRTAYLGAGSAMGAQKHVQREKEIEEKYKDEQENKYFTPVTGDYKEDVWHSPLYIVDLIADHKANEVTSYESYDFYREMGSILTGTVFGIYTHYKLNHVINRIFPVRDIIKSLFQSKAGVSNGAKLSRGVSISAALGETIIGGGIAYSLYWAGAKVTKKVSDISWEYLLNKKYKKHKEDLLQVKGKYWEEQLGTKIDGLMTYYEPVLRASQRNIDYDLKISMGLFNKLNFFKHVVEQKAEYYRGKAEKRERERVEEFINDYMCTGLRYQKYYYDLKDLNRGVTLPEGVTRLSTKRAKALYQEGVDQLVLLEQQFKQDLIDMESEFSNDEMLRDSQKIYVDAISVLEKVAKRSNRYFVSNVINELKASQNSEIYMNNPEVVFQNIMNLSGNILTKTLEDPKLRFESTCLDSTYQDLKEEYWNK